MRKLIKKFSIGGTTSFNSVPWLEDMYNQEKLIKSWEDNYTQLGKQQQLINAFNKFKTNADAWLNYNTVDSSQMRQQKLILDRMHNTFNPSDYSSIKLNAPEGDSSVPSKITLSNGVKSLFDTFREELKKYLDNWDAERQQRYETAKQEIKAARQEKLANGLKKGINAFSMSYDFIPTADDTINNTDGQVEQLRGKTALLMMQSGNPWLMAAGATVGVLDKTGAFGDASEGLGGWNDFGNAAMAYLTPGIGWMKGLETDKYNVSEALGSSSGYTGTRNFAEKAQKNAGARFLFGRRKANDMIASAKIQDDQVQGILGLAKDDFNLAGNMAEINGLRIQNITSGGNQMMRAAKHGIKFLPTKDQIAKAKLSASKKTVKFKNFITLDDFIQYIHEKGLDQNDDYDYVKFFGDRSAFEQWNNDQNSNKHFSDKYKKPNHITFSQESIYSTDKTPGGKWYKDKNGKQHYTPSDYVKSQHSYEKMSKYFKENEPDAILDWEQTLKFENGGQMNVIPDGALHARLHHMEDVNPDLKGQITKKGIPVVSEGEGGEIEQQAEIEKNELILAKDVTDAIEELKKKYEEENKDEYAIMAGLILAQLIMENTDDRTGLIQQIG